MASDEASQQAAALEDLAARAGAIAERVSARAAHARSAEDWEAGDGADDAACPSRAETTGLDARLLFLDARRRTRLAKPREQIS